MLKRTPLSNDLGFFRGLYVVEVSSSQRWKTMDNTFEVEIADKSGHSVVQMTQEQIAEKAESAPGTWVFVNDQLVSTADVARHEH